MHEAVLRTFCDPLPEQYAKLWQLSAQEWQTLLHWLDTSGLALYFLDRVLELQLSELLPRAVMARLQQNLIDNTERMRGMVDESIALHSEFQNAGLSYATLKGFSLWPYSVPKPQLRSQLDLNFLMAGKSVAQRGKCWSAEAIICGDLWQKLGVQDGRGPGTSLKNLYKNTPNRCVELHVETSLKAALPYLGAP